MAAEQAASVVDQEVIVVRSKTVPQEYGCDVSI